MRPVWLDANQPPRFFAGGPAIARLRGEPAASGFAPEDWVGSTTPLFGETEVGLTRLPDGRWLTDAMAADPEAFLGPAHAEVWGADPALLVKLLEAGQRLPVHCHPDRRFARRHLDCPYGKTEAWIVLGTEGPEPRVHLGFRVDQDLDELAQRVEQQDSTALLDAMNAVPVEVGDAILVPAGLPHAIGEGVFVLELQEPTDLSVLMEWAGFDIDGERHGHLGLGFDLALQAVDLSGWDERRLAGLRQTSPRDTDTSTVGSLFPAAADPYFRAERIDAEAVARLAPGFSILVAVTGEGSLSTEHGGEHRLRRGDTVLLPYASGRIAVGGDVQVVRCRPPDPAVVQDAW